VTWENGYVESFNGKLRDELLNKCRVWATKRAFVASRLKGSLFLTFSFTTRLQA